MSELQTPLGELGIIELLRAALPTPAPWVERALGDDCAIVRSGDEWLLLTKDLLVQGVHFRRGDLSASELGYKALAVNVSDIAAMGGDPALALLGLGVPPGVGSEWIAGLRDGLLECAAEFGVDLVGGDTVAAPGGAVISITLVGKAAPGRVVLRSGGAAGDVVALGGPVGGSAAGLQVLLASEAGRDAATWTAPERQARRCHLRPVPQVALGRLLAGRGFASAMLDGSAGLLLDLSRICAASGVGARIDPRLVPQQPWASTVASQLGQDATEWALRGGEDYVLLFTVERGRWGELLGACKEAGLAAPVAVGELQAAEGLWLGASGQARRALPGGYEHLAP